LKKKEREKRSESTPSAAAAAAALLPRTSYEVVRGEKNTKRRREKEKTFHIHIQIIFERLSLVFQEKRKKFC